MLDNAHQQNQSPFFQRLPAELRLIIYAFVFLKQTVHIMTHKGHVFYVADGFPNPVRDRPRELMGLLCKDMLYGVRPRNGLPCFYARRCHGFDILYTPCRYQPLAIGGLVRTCRLLYVESVSLLYTNMPFHFECTHSFNVFCNAISTNQQFTSPRLMFIRDIRISVPCLDIQCIRDTNAGLILLTEQAVRLKRFKLQVQQRCIDGDTRADIWYGERRRLLKKTLRILGSFRGLESFALDMKLSRNGRPALSGKKISGILRELVFQPKGSGIMTARQFHNHFKIGYQASMA